MTRAFLPVRPVVTREQAVKLIFDGGGTVPLTGPFLVGVRGYSDAEGDGNDVGRYDDLIVLVCPDKVVAFNANCDPQRQVLGRATLKAGTFMYQLGIHNLSKPKAEQYPALVQAGPVTVSRWQAKDETGYFGINIHRGGHSTSTNSAGCQTIPPAQWAEFYADVEAAIAAAGVKTIPYLLMDFHVPDAR